MSQVNTRFPTVGSFMSKLASAPTSKLAEGSVSDPGPDSSHPASVGADSGNLPVPSGDIPSKADSFTSDALPTTGVQPSDSAVEDKEAKSVNTETGKDGSEISGLMPTDKVEDVSGQDSGHPAKAGEEKYASCTTISDVCNIMLKDLDALAASVEASIKQASAPVQTPAPVQSNEPPANASQSEKVAHVLREIIPEEGNMREIYAQKVASFLEPLVLDGISRADKLATFIKLASDDPAMAAQMMGGDPAAGGMPPEAMGGGMPPEAMGGGMPGGDPSGGMPPGGEGGGSPEEQIIMLIEQIAQQTGQPPEAILEQLLAQEGGGGEGGGGMPPGGDAGGPPPDAGGPPPGAEGAGSGAPPDEPPPEEKSAAFPGTPKQQTVRKKIAQLLATEIGKTPAQVAKSC